MHSKAGPATLLSAFQADHDTLFKRAVSTTELRAAGGRAFDRYGGVGGFGRPGRPANDDEAPKPDAEGTAAE